MYLPNVILTDIRTDWMHTSPNRNRSIGNLLDNNTNCNRNNNNSNNNGNSNSSRNSRKSDFPSLSSYTPVKPTPYHLNSLSKKILKILENSNTSHDIEGLDTIAMEMGLRLQKMKEVDTWGYNWLRPIGVGKTMSQMIEERKLMEEEAELQRQEESNDLDNQDYNDDNEMAEDAHGIEDLDQLHNNSNNNISQHNITATMAENFGQSAMPSNNHNHNQNHNNTNNAEDTTGEDTGNNVIYGNNSTTEHEEYAMERDLDADLSNHDSNDYNIEFGNYEGNQLDDLDDQDSQDYEEEDDEEPGDQVIIEDSDDDGDYSSENHGHSQSNINITHREDMIQSIMNADHNLHSSFDEDFQNLINNNANKKRERYSNDDERFFMAFEDYQDDHSMLEGRSNARNVSNPESVVFTHGSNVSSGRPVVELNTISTMNSNVITQSTGNTSVLNTTEAEEGIEIRASDFDMTLD